MSVLAPLFVPTDLSQSLLPALRRMAVAAAIVSYAWAMPAFVLHDPTPSWPDLLAPSLALAGSLLSVRSASSLRRGAVPLVIGLALAACTEAAMCHTNGAQLAAVAALLTAGLLLGPRAGAAVGAALFVVVAALAIADRAAWAAAVPLLRLILLESATVWFLVGSIHQVLASADADLVRMREHARDAMERRADLQRTSKALHGMYALLERTNHELETSRREAEEAKEIKARFAANISHELRTPLNLILGFSRMMCRAPEVYGKMRWPPELRADVNEIYRASRHLLEMVDDILDLSRVDAQRLPLRLEPSSIATLIADAVKTARGLLRQSPVVVTTDVPDDLPEVIVDRTRIRQVLLNLLSNAIRFTDEGRIEVRAAVAEGELCVTVTDTGAGIPVDDLPTIFDEFAQARGPITSGRGGAGLGLAVCRQFVQLHGGHITAESEPGKGSAFRFTIPLEGMGKARSRLFYYSPDGWAPPLLESPLGKAAVLLTSDGASMRTLARGVEGYRILPLTDLTGLRQLVEAEHPAGVLLATDPLLPGSGIRPEDVWDATGRPDLGVVECEVPLETAASRQLGVSAYLTKPVEADRLLAEVRRCAPGAASVLVVDDDPGFRALMERSLRSALPDALVHTGTAEEALSLLARRPWDLLLVDLLMPGMGGLELVQRAREQGLLVDTPVIVITAASYAEQVARLFPSRLHFHRKAPPRGSEWFACIRAMLDAAPPDYSLPAAAAGPGGTHPLPRAS